MSGSGIHLRPRFAVLFYAGQCARQSTAQVYGLRQLGGKGGGKEDFPKPNFQRPWGIASSSLRSSRLFGLHTDHHKPAALRRSYQEEDTLVQGPGLQHLPQIVRRLQWLTIRFGNHHPGGQAG